MKKSLVVLTILVLVAGFAFAAVTGTVEARYTFDFTGEEKTLEYDVLGSSSKVSFTVSTEQAKVDGSNKPYATVTVDVVLAAKLGKTDLHALKEYDYLIASWLEVDDFTLGVKLSDFRIVGENWEVDFLKAIAVGDYAKSVWEIDDSDDENALDAPWAFKKSKGVTFTYDGYKLGLSAERREDDDFTLNVKLRSESKEIEFAEGIKGQVAVGVGLSKVEDADLVFDFGVSAKAAYEKDDLAVSGAFDLQYVGKKFDADVAVKVAVKPVTVDAYYATNVVKTSQRYFFDSKENIASVRVAVALDPVTVTLYGENLVNNDRILAIKEEGKFGAFGEDAQFGIMPTLGKQEIFGNITAGLWFANAGAHYDIQENLTVNAHVGFERMYFKDGVNVSFSGLAVQAGAEYKLEVATITADAYVGKVFSKVGDESNNTDLYFACKVAAKSDKLVENAVLSATLNIDKNGVIGLYKSTRAVDEYSGEKDGTYLPYDLGTPNMSFTVSCKVNF